MTVKILLVAREPASRDRLRLALERLGTAGDPVEFHDASEGNDALALAERVRPDLVVAEVGATPYGAFGLARDIKAYDDLACPVVLILERPQDAWLARWSGTDALVHQPVDPFALAEVAKRLVADARADAAPATT